MTTFYLIRHAEKAADNGVLAGRTPGLHLSEVGRAQAARVAERLAREPIAHVFASPLERARETAAPLAQARALTARISEDIGEIDVGEWTGRKFCELDADERWHHFNRFRSGTRIPGGETALAVQARFVGALLHWRDEYVSAHVALVSHADPIKIALATFLGAPLDLYDRLEIGLASVSVVRVGRDWAKVLCVNSTA